MPQIRWLTIPCNLSDNTTASREVEEILSHTSLWTTTSSRRFMPSVRGSRCSLRYLRVLFVHALLCVQASAHNVTSIFDAGLPACGMTCARDAAAAASNNCTNVGCLCGTFSFVESFFECVAESCSEANIKKVNETVGALCNQGMGISRLSRIRPQLT